MACPCPARLGKMSKRPYARRAVAAMAAYAGLNGATLKSTWKGLQ